MSAIIQNEIFFFLVSVSVGVLMLFGYDLLRALRTLFPHGTILLAVEDFLYWCAAGIAVFLVIFIKNSGVLRGFSLMAILIGMVLYNQSVSRLIMKGISNVLKLAARTIRTILRVILFPFVFLTKKIGKSARKRLKKQIKKVKMKIHKNTGEYLKIGEDRE